jgi:type I restriction enzyme M protein
VEARFQRERAFIGVELVEQTHKLALMNAMLHGIHGTIIRGDALGDVGASLKAVDVILTNPPFGAKRGAGLPERSFPVSTSNKQLAFLQHVYLGLKPRGRAAVIVPDLQGSAAPKVCRELMDRCDLHTVLRLPTGIFYAQGVKTNVYFFTRGTKNIGNTREVWVYDMRTNMPLFAKRTPLTREHFEDFEKAFGSDPNGKSKRKDQGKAGRFRRFDREFIRQGGDTLDITWLGESSMSQDENALGLDALASQIVNQLHSALKELKALQGARKP